MQGADLVYVGQQLVKAGRLALHSARPGLQTADSIVVADLLDRRFSTVTEIAQRTGYAQSRVSKAVATLRDQGLVRTRIDPADRRRSVVYLVDQGSETGEAGVSNVDEVLDKLLANADKRDRAAIRAALEKLVVVLRSPIEPVGHVDPAGGVMHRWAQQLGISRARLEQLNSVELAALVDARNRTSARAVEPAGLGDSNSTSLAAVPGRS